MKLTINIELEVLEKRAIEMVVDEFFMDELEGLIAGDGLRVNQVLVNLEQR